MIGGFSRYNQIIVHPEYHRKTTFTIPWGTLMYAQFHFGLMNVAATFQRVMNMTFIGEKDKFLVLYLYEKIVFSNLDVEHLQHLQHTFEKCRKYGLSLNLNKSQFSLRGCKHLGHTVSK